MAEKIQPFQFDLTKTLFFHRNEGVQEMLGIGLDPEITIESKDDHVSVRGVIALTGEYLPVFVDDERDVEDEDHIQSRYFKKVERDDDGVCEFTHHFPIDISVPHERIKNLEDLTVSINHFDYQIPDERKLELEATIQIDGLEYQSISRPLEERENSVEEETLAEDLDLELEDERDIHFDIKIKEEEDEKEEEITSTTVPEDEQSEEVADPVDEIKEETEEKVINLRKKIETKPTEEDEIEEVPEIIVDEGDNEEREDPEEIFNEEDASEDAEGDEERVEEPTYLLGLFEQEEEERYTQMKIYIAQEDDSLEQVAEEYQVSTLKLQQANRLDGTSIYKGQILYVPESQKSKK